MIGGYLEKELYINQAECVGCELCVKISTAFILNDCEKAEIKDGWTGEDEEIQDAINNCPACCMHWQAKNSGCDDSNPMHYVR